MMRIRDILSVWLVIVFVAGCGTDETPVSSVITEDGIDRIILDGSASKDPEGSIISFQWSSTTPGIGIQDANLPKAYFKIPEGPGLDASVSLTVRDGNSAQTTEQIISVPAWSQVRAYGLGVNLNAEADNTVPYEWYLDQDKTGSASLVNCGPTSVTMAAKWFDPDFSLTPQDARNTYYNEGGWWYTSDMIAYLDMYAITNWTIKLPSIDTLKKQIDNGNIAILCLDMYYVSEGTIDDHRYNKFYKTDGEGWGHFIVVKGYKKVDDKFYFEAYDPYSFGRKYSDMSLKGRNRYYLDTDLYQATQKWWPYAIVVSKNSSQGGRRAVNNSTIPHMPGR